MTGFNDFFFAIGILLLGCGMIFFTGGKPLPSLAAAVLIWALSELLVRRMRLVLPGILLSLFFIVFIYIAVPSELVSASSLAASGVSVFSGFQSLLGLDGPPLTVAAKALTGAGAAALYYWRFRLPFTLLPIAASLVLVCISAVILAIGPLPELAKSLSTLICGTAVFAAALSFDMSDRERMTRRSDCAFWLHLLAAPLIVHSLISLITPSFAQMTNNGALVVLCIVLILAVVAIAIDRRALLVSALLYIGIVISYALGGAVSGRGGTAQGAVFFTTLVILGAFVITLGIAWLPLRRSLVALLPSAIAAKLPPIPNRT